MRKFYVSFLAFAAMMLVSLTAKAAVAAETLINNRDAVAENFEGYGVYHYWNFKTLSRDGAEAGSWSIAPNAIDNMMPITTVGFENFHVAIGRGSATNPDLRYRDTNYGIYEFGSGARTLRMLDMKAGMIVVINGAQGQTYDYYDKGVVNTTMAKEITDSIHKIQKEKEVEEGEPAPVADEYRYIEILQDGTFDFSVNRGCYILSIVVLLNQSAPEAVSSPSLKVTAVNYDSRTLEFKPGESTYGNPVVTYYSTDGSDPVFLKDSEEVDHYEYVYDTDGETVLEDIPVYKKVLDMDAVADAGGLFGENPPYDPEMGYIAVDANFDEDDGVKDNIVTVKAVSVSVETGVLSDIITLPVSVEEITLNAPTFTLIGINGEERTYAVGWTNNTLCEEEYQIILETGEGGYYEQEPNTGIGATVTSAQSVKATVKVEGYYDGANEKDVDYAGIDITRKNPSEDGEGNTIHDWDFTTLTNYQSALIKQDYSIDENIIESCYIIEDPAAPEEKTYYTKDEFINGEAADGTDLSEATPVLKASGWNWDGSRNRAMRIPVVTNTIYTDETNTAVDHYEFDGYEEDAVGLFTNGLSITGADPYTGSSKFIGSSQYIYIYPEQTGYLYLSGNAQLNFDEETVKYGEFVVVTYTEGNPDCVCVNNRAAGYSHSVKNANIRYIDIYTTENLPEVPEEIVGVENIKTPVAKKGVRYNLAGQRVNENYKGIVIMDGKAVLVQ